MRKNKLSHTFVWWVLFLSGLFAGFLFFYLFFFCDIGIFVLSENRFLLFTYFMGSYLSSIFNVFLMFVVIFSPFFFVYLYIAARTMNMTFNEKWTTQVIEWMGFKILRILKKLKSLSPYLKKKRRFFFEWKPTAYDFSYSFLWIVLKIRPILTKFE